MDYSCLTDEQKTTIKQAAIDATFQDAQQDDGYLMGLVKMWIDEMSIEDQVLTISGDPDMLPELLAFDPNTGEEWSEK